MVLVSVDHTHPDPLGGDHDRASLRYPPLHPSHQGKRAGGRRSRRPVRSHVLTLERLGYEVDIQPLETAARLRYQPGRG